MYGECISSQFNHLEPNDRGPHQIRVSTTEWEVFQHSALSWRYVQ